MSTITRELAKLFRKITNSEIDSEGNAHAVLSPADSTLINRARIALASLEAEPVSEFYHEARGDGMKYQKVTKFLNGRGSHCIRSRQRRDLVKAGALILAEIERIDRQEAAQ